VSGSRSAPLRWQAGGGVADCGPGSSGPCMWRGFCDRREADFFVPGLVVRVPMVALCVVGVLGCGGVSVPANEGSTMESGVSVSESAVVEPGWLLPDELDGLHGQMTAELVEEHLPGELDCRSDLCGGVVPFVLEAATESSYSHFEFYFDVDGARPLYQVVGVPRAGWEPTPLVAMRVDSAGVSLGTGAGHRLRVQVVAGRVVWTWERTQ